MEKKSKGFVLLSHTVGIFYIPISFFGVGGLFSVVFVYLCMIPAGSSNATDSLCKSILGRPQKWFFSQEQFENTVLLLVVVSMAQMKLYGLVKKADLRKISLNAE